MSHTNAPGATSEDEQSRVASATKQKVVLKPSDHPWGAYAGGAMALALGASAVRRARGAWERRPIPSSAIHPNPTCATVSASVTSRWISVLHHDGSKMTAHEQAASLDPGDEKRLRRAEAALARTEQARARARRRCMDCIHQDDGYCRNPLVVLEDGYDATGRQIKTREHTEITRGPDGMCGPNGLFFEGMTIGWLVWRHARDVAILLALLLAVVLLLVGMWTWFSPNMRVMAVLMMCVITMVLTARQGLR